jgi:hypothetical protein
VTQTSETLNVTGVLGLREYRGIKIIRADEVVQREIGGQLLLVDSSQD